MRSSEVYFDDTGKIRKVYAPDEFIAKNIEIEKKMAAEAAEANKRARLEQSREILKFYNLLQKQQNPQPSLSLEPQPQQPKHHQQPRTTTTQQSSGNNAASSSSNTNNVLRNLKFMRKIAGDY
jgi:hypothetical protein